MAQHAPSASVSNGARPDLAPVAAPASASTSASAADVQAYHLSEPEATPAFPTLEPLSHNLALLSPKTAPDFNVDDFLVSRSKASDLSYILSDLRSYNESLKHELVSIINQDYKDFVSLGSGLRSESHRIERLGWSASSDPTDPANPGAAAGGGAMAPVRAVLVEARDTLQGVEDDIRDCMRRRDEAAQRKARLDLMLQLHDSVTRLEELLLIPKGARRKQSLGSADGGSALPFAAGDSNEVAAESGAEDYSGSDYGLSSDYDDDDDDAEAEGAADDYLSAVDPTGSPTLQRAHANGAAASPAWTKSPGPMHHAERKRQRRQSRARTLYSGHLGSGLPHSPPMSRRPANAFLSLDEASRRRSKHRPDGRAVDAEGASSLLVLPQRVARTSAEYSRLRFLSKRIESEGLSGFSNALHNRMEHIRSTLRQDLRSLLKRLLSPSSLLLRGWSLEAGQTSAPPRSPVLRRWGSIKQASRNGISLEAHELESWSQVASVGDGAGSEAESAYWAERLQEQRGWLEMVLVTLASLGPSGTGLGGEPSGAIESSRPVKEAEEAVRELFVQGWASEAITATTLQNPEYGTGINHQEEGGARGHLATAARQRLQSALLRLAELGFAEEQGSDQGLVHLYNKILAFAATDAWQVCDAAEATSSHGTSAAPPIGGVGDVSAAATVAVDSKTTCDVFVNVLWEEVATRLMDEELASSIFFVGRPDAFYKNYTISSAFLDRFASLAPSPRAYSALLRHPHWLVFRKRWQLPVYFQMRCREIITKLEDELAHGSQLVSASEASASPPLLQATAATLEAVRAPWSTGVHLHELSAREWRVTLQVLCRFKTWIEAEIPEDLVTAGLVSNAGPNGSAVAGSAAAPGSRRIEGLRQHSRTGSDGTRSSMDGYRTTATASGEISRVATPGSASRGSSEVPRDTATDDATLAHLTSLVVDLLHLSSSIHDVFESDIRPRLFHRVSAEERSADEAESDQELVELLKKTLDETLAFKASLVDQVGRAATSMLRTKCCDPLRLVRSAGTQYRSLTASVGGKVEASPFVEQVLRPLLLFFGLGPSTATTTTSTASGEIGVRGVGKHLPLPLRSEWTNAVLSDVLMRYASALITMNKNHESLRRLKRGTASGISAFASSLFSNAAAAGGAGETDEAGEKMRRQMHVDIEKIREGVKRLEQDGGVRVDWEMEAWSKLEYAVGGGCDE
ncbi:hypothetical protein ACQY0O_001044 [Thecaphora frezii]